MIEEDTTHNKTLKDIEKFKNMSPEEKLEFKNKLNNKNRKVNAILCLCYPCILVYRIFL
jgi:hypothetical protein